MVDECSPPELLHSLSNLGHRSDIRSVHHHQTFAISDIILFNVKKISLNFRTVCFSSDDSKILSASSNSLKLWNRSAINYFPLSLSLHFFYFSLPPCRSSLQCTATLSCGYALCSTFVPGDRHVVIGTKVPKVVNFMRFLNSNSLSFSLSLPPPLYTGR